MKLSTYTGVRVLMAIPTLFILLVVIFFLMRVLPGDPVAMMIGEKAPPQEIERVRHILGFDRPLHEQFFSYIRAMLTGDFGESLVTHRPVIGRLVDAYPVTLELAVLSIILGVALGIPMGIIGALKKGLIADHVLRVFTFGTYSMPSFWLGMIFQILFAWHLGILPVAGRLPATLNIPRLKGFVTIDSLLQLRFDWFAESLKYLLLPSLTLALSVLPRISRIVRSSVLDEMREEYITTARAKGIPERTIVYRHALRNALLPTLTVTGMTFAGLLGGVVLIEMVFSLPGLGRLLVDGLLNRDFPMVQAIVFVYAIVVVIVNTITDVIYAILDPRVRY